MKKLFAFSVLALLTATALWSLDVGDRVLADWTGDGYWYPGTIVNEDGGQYHVVYDDYSREWLDASDIVLEDLGEGDRVSSRWLGGSVFYPGYIYERIGDAVWIKYDDGDEEFTTIAHVRVE